MSVVANAQSSTQAQVGLDTANLQIDDIISHRLFARDTNKVIKDPILQTKVMNLPEEGVDAIQKRMTAALGNRSHGLEVSIENTDTDSFMQLAADAICRSSREVFINASQTMAKKLSASQAGTSGLPGVIFVIRGRIGKTPQRFLAVIKAEVHDGFGTGESEETIAVQYLKTLMLTPAQRLYKVGLLLEVQSAIPLQLGDYEPSHYRAFLFDHLVTATETRSAAAYFYSGFLGMGIQKSSKKLTRDFFEHTEAFIKTASLSDEKKWELREALRVELRSSSGVISVTDFAEANIEDQDVQDAYCVYLHGQGFPKNAVTKDVAYVKTRLRRPRKWAFSSGVKIVIPSDAGSDSVVIKKKTAAATTVLIKGSITETT